MRRLRTFQVALFILSWAATPHSAWADPPKVLALRTQKVGDATYFHVRLEVPSLRNDFNVRREPRLVPQDARTSSVYWHAFNGLDSELEFFGKVQDENARAGLLLVQPTAIFQKKKRESWSLEDVLEARGKWTEEPVTLDFSKAVKVPLPAVRRRLPRPGEGFRLNNDDLEGRWAKAQIYFFERLDIDSPDNGFASLAELLTQQKYEVQGNRNKFLHSRRHGLMGRGIYDFTVSPTAVMEFHASRRLIDADFTPPPPGSINIGDVRGIDVVANPAAKLLAGKKPTIEKLARFVPQDNYYVHFKNIVKFLETGDLMDHWGTALAHVLETRTGILFGSPTPQVNSQDHHVRPRLEQQLCLKSTKLARVFGPAVVKSMALTGSDLSLHEGTDVTIIFQVANKDLFLANAEPHIKEARANFAGQLKENKQEYEQITIESFVTPLREVSLHRAVFEDFIIVSNSPVGIRRVIDAYKGKLKSLADAQDFQYLRSVYRLEDPLEDGFVFLSDPFIRQLMGPASRIKQWRRLEALASLSIVNNAALFMAWETGKLPASHKDLLAYTGLKPSQLFVPEGEPAVWDGAQKVAVSSLYNTLSFATPLIELPLVKVTMAEKKEYEQFHSYYYGGWRDYFDPIGIRIQLGNEAGNPKQVRAEFHTLPLTPNSYHHENMRRLTGNGGIKFDSRMFSDKTIFQFLAHISPKAPERDELSRNLRDLSKDIPAIDWLGDWFTIRLDDSPIYGKLLERHIIDELTHGNMRFDEDEMKLVAQIPLTLGVEIRNPLVFAIVLAVAKKELSPGQRFFPPPLIWEPLKEPYKGVTLVEIKPKEARDQWAAVYYALVDGVWYISLRQQPIHDEIDRALARKASGGTKPIDNKGEVNAAFRASGKPEHIKEFLPRLLEWETHRRAVANAHLWHPLYRTGILKANDDVAVKNKAALRYFGFVPVSPDNTAYIHDSKIDEVTNERHGSQRRPKLAKTLAAGSPLQRFLEDFQTLDVDLRYDEFAVNAVVTLQRK